MSEEITLVWFRQDLRVTDNPALREASSRGKILPIYILDDDNAGEERMGAASRVWLHFSLKDLTRSLNNNLQVFNGNAEKIILKLVKKHHVSKVVWNRCYEPWRIKRDKKIKSKLEELSIEVESFNGSLLWEPWTIKNKQDKPYKVFTPFYRKGCLKAPSPRKPLRKPSSMRCVSEDNSLKSIDGLSLLPQSLDWHKGMCEHWEISQQGAKSYLDDFLDDGINDYKEGRNFPAKNNVSRLSPYLHFGLISPHQVWHAAQSQSVAHKVEKQVDIFCSELGWREFSYQLLFYNPELSKKNLQTKFNQFPWSKSKKNLHAWQKGLTGCPIVDAGMRELWQTGYMHNRVRMIVGSFLVKNLMLHWRDGAAWFWDCLFDADMANNNASWQWVAGCGADAAPYFRIFNPVTQGEKFDEAGEYVRRYVPELKSLPNKYIHKPWDAPKEVLSESNIKLGKDYPNIIVDLKESRQDALNAFSSLKEESK